MAANERTQAILLADVAGNAKLYQRLSDTEAQYAIERVQKRVERAIETHGGRLAKTVADESIALFDHPEAATQAALDMQQRVDALPAISGVKLTLRIGVHVGEVGDENGEPAGSGIETSARLVGLASCGQIFVSKAVMDGLPTVLRETGRPSGEHHLKGAADKVAVFVMPWKPGGDVAPIDPSPAEPAPPANVPLTRCCLRYRGKAFLLDSKTALLTLGRDRNNDLVIEDRKASRQHARIERRGNAYFYVDQSTNGTYISPRGQRESLLRHGEIQLFGTGVICFGTSINEPTADSAEYEFL